jgi:hypothetical protein
MKKVASCRDIAFAALLVFNLTICQGASGAGERNSTNQDTAALLAALPKCKVALADGLKYATRGREVPISAEFRLDENGKLLLSVYTAGGGVKLAPEYNVLSVLRGSAEEERWLPYSLMVKDAQSESRATNYLLLNAMSSRTVLEIVDDAAKRHSGTVLSIAPEVRGGKPVFVVLMADKGNMSENVYDIRAEKWLAAHQ